MTMLPEITVYGADWCPDTRRAKRLLEEHKVTYKWVDIEQDKEGEQLVIQVNHGNRSIPTIIFGDGLTLTEPSDLELLARIG
jgi:mycoredoxin